MGWRSILVLLLIGAGIGAGLWFTREQPPPPVPPAPEVLGGRRFLDARKVVLRLEDSPAIWLERRADGSFGLTEPVVDLASDARLRSIADVYDATHLTKVFAPEQVTPKVLADTGLDRPRRVELWYDDEANGGPGAATKADVVLAIGQPHPLGRQVFVQKDGAVWLGELGLRTALDVRPADLREMRLFANVPDGVTRVEVRTREQKDTMVVERRGGEFLITEPLRTRVAGDVMQMFLVQLTAMRASEFTPSQVDPGRPADIHVEIRGHAGTEAMDLWHTPSSFVVGRVTPRNVDFAIDPREFGRLFAQPVDTLRARLLVPVENEAIERLELQAPGARQPIVLRPGNDGGVLQLWSPVEAAADPTAVAKLLQALRNLQAIEFVPAGDRDAFGFGAGQPAFELRIDARQQGGRIVVRLGNDEGELTYAMRADDDFVVKVPKEVADEVRRPWPAFVARQVWQVEHASFVRRIVLARGEQSHVFVRTPEALGWQREGASSPSSEAADLFERLRDLRADDVLDPAAAGELGPGLELSLQRDNGDALHRLFVHRSGDRWLATRPGLGVVYVLPAAVGDLIARLAP